MKQINAYTAVFLFFSTFGASNVSKGISVHYISITTQVHFIREMHRTQDKTCMSLWVLLRGKKTVLL